MILVAIVTYNGLKWIDSLLQPFLYDRDQLEIAVVDNASTDGTPDEIEKRYPFVRVLRRPSNLGFGAANNLLMEEVQAKECYEGIFLLNQDASISAETIRALADYSQQHPEIGILSPLHLSSNGAVEQGFAHYLPEPPYHGFTELSFINAALWYLPRQTLLKVGLFSPLFHHYGEDLDYAHRVRFAGLKIGFLPHLTGQHLRPSTAISDEKTLRLKQAYHLAEAINPLLSPFAQFYRGHLAPFGEALLSRGNRRWPLLKMARNLWQMRPMMKLWRQRPPLDLEGLQRALDRKELPPLLLFVYNRPKHTERILQNLLQQPEITNTPIYIWSDGAKSADDQQAVEEVRALCRQFPKAQLHCQPTNRGLAHNIVEGVTNLLQTHDRVIVLEDDLILSPYFLRWMNDALSLYASEKRIAHLHAGTFYTSPKLRNNHPLYFAGSWGWATWQDRWQELWEPDGKQLLQQLERDPKLYQRFRYGGFMDFPKMLRRQIAGENNSWAIRWHASLLLHQKLSVNSNPPLVSNDGFDGSGTHSGGGGRYHTAVAPYPLYADPIAPTSEDPEAYHILRRYYARTNNKVMKGWYKLKELWQRYFG